CILVKFSWHIPDFPIYSNGTKPGTLHIAWADTSPKQRKYLNSGFGVRFPDGAQQRNREVYASRFFHFQS
ncbi:hypothetical protein, partial [Corynebacterium accolens]|uniref:hypothetical protein n=1 Tax=Corynebacterium accolens TaxID=38284 RepID=UPI00254D86A0